MITSPPSGRSRIANLCFAGTRDGKVYLSPSKTSVSPADKSFRATRTLSRGSSFSTSRRRMAGVVGIRDYCNARTRQQRSDGQPPEALRIGTEHGIADTRTLSVQVLFHEIERLLVRRRDKAHRPIGAGHEPVGAERFKGGVEIGNDVFRIPVLPIGFRH